jgi:DNA-binding MarR family transcriptional regulator
VCLSAIVSQEQMTLVDLSIQVHLSPSTLVGIVDRLESAGLVSRLRSTADRRRVLITATTSGVESVRKAPSPLQTRLVAELAKLSVAEQATLAQSLSKIAGLMEAHEIRVAPLLTLERKSYAATTNSAKRNTSGKKRSKKVFTSGAD